jgi:hypothetical protein
MIDNIQYCIVKPYVRAELGDIVKPDNISPLDDRFQSFAIMNKGYYYKI